MFKEVQLSFFLFLFALLFFIVLYTKQRTVRESTEIRFLQFQQFSMSKKKLLLVHQGTQLCPVQGNRSSVLNTTGQQLYCILFSLKHLWIRDPSRFSINCKCKLNIYFQGFIIILYRAGQKMSSLFGRALAEKIANYLLSGGTVARGHRDYCGMGLAYCFKKKKFAYGWVGYDGYDLYPGLSWDTKQQFIQWLEKQSDESLSCSGDKYTEYNQTITKERLEKLENQSYVRVLWKQDQQNKKQMN